MRSDREELEARMFALRTYYAEARDLLIVNNPDPEQVSLGNEVFWELVKRSTLGEFHGSRVAYQHGCRGPLCKFAEREYQREKYVRVQLSQGKIVRPYESTRALDSIMKGFIDYHADHFDEDQRLAEALTEAEMAGAMIV